MIGCVHYGTNNEWTYDTLNFVHLSPWKFDGTGTVVKLNNAGMRKSLYKAEDSTTFPTSYISFCSTTRTVYDPWCGYKTFIVAVFMVFSFIVSIANVFLCITILFQWKIPTWDGSGRVHRLSSVIIVCSLHVIFLICSLVTWWSLHVDIGLFCQQNPDYTAGITCANVGSSFYALCILLVISVFDTLFWRMCYTWEIARESGEITDQFVLAAKLDDVDEILAAIANNINIDANGSDGRNALHWSCAMNQSSVSHILLRKGASISKKDKDGWTPLHWASRMGNTDIVRLLAKYGADVNARDLWGTTPLMLSVVGGSEQAAETLVKLGAEIDMSNVFGQTCLMMCAEEGSLRRSFLVILTKLGASSRKSDKQGSNVLHYAASAGDKYMLSTLLETSNPEQFAEGNKFGETPLDEARIRNKTHTISLLLEWSTGEHISASEDSEDLEESEWSEDDDLEDSSDI